MKQRQCRVFLKNPKGEFKRIYSLRAFENKRGEKSIQAQLWSTIICKELGIPPSSEIHYQIPSNGKDFHLSIKYIDQGPFQDAGIISIENYMSFYPNQPEYKHKQVFLKKNDRLTNSHFLPFTADLKPKHLIGYPPNSFDQHIKGTTPFPIYYLPTIGTPISPLSSQTSDKWKTMPTNHDVIIEESYEPNAQISVCGFLGKPGSFPQAILPSRLSSVVSIGDFPDFGVSVILNHKLSKT